MPPPGARGHCRHASEKEDADDPAEPILFATDGSPSAEEAQKEAFELAERLGAPLARRLRRACVVARGRLQPRYGYSNIVAELTEAEHHRVTALLASVAEAAEAEGVHCSTVAADGFARRGDLPDREPSTTHS